MGESKSIGIAEAGSRRSLSVPARRRMRRLAPVLVGASLVMILASLFNPVTTVTTTGSRVPLSMELVSSGPSPVSNCFGGSPCTGPSGTTDGSGTTCVISSYSETAGDFMYVAINYLDGSNIITSVSDGGVDGFAYVGGEFANSQSVAFYDVASEHGGNVTITVTISSNEFGTCRVGQLDAGTILGVVGAGSSVASGTSLSVTNSANQGPSLLLALFGSTRPSGGWTLVSPSGGWMTGGQQLTGYNPGTVSELFGYNDTTSGTVTFTASVTSSVSISGIVVQFYRAGGPYLPPYSDSWIYNSPGCSVICGNNYVLAEETFTNGQVQNALESKAVGLEGADILAETGFSQYVGVYTGPSMDYQFVINWTYSWYYQEVNICAPPYGDTESSVTLEVLTGLYDDTSESWVISNLVTGYQSASLFCPLVFYDDEGSGYAVASFNGYMATDNAYSIFSWVQVYTSAVAVGVAGAAAYGYVGVDYAGPTTLTYMLW